MGEAWRNAGRASEIAYKWFQLRERGFGVELGKVLSPCLLLSCMVFIANWIVALIISMFGVHFLNNSSFEGLDQPLNRYKVSPYLDPV